MDKKIEERLEYLKTVKMEEIAVEIQRIHATCGDLSECPEYDKAMCKKYEIEQEIRRIESGKEPKGFFIDEIDWIYKYFDNDDFIKANLDKQFSMSDRIALIVYSRKISMEDKFADLQKMVADENGELKDSVEKWIANKKEILGYIQNLHRDDVAFLITFDGGSVGNPKIYRSFDAVIADSSARYFGISIERVFDAKAKTYGKLGAVRFNSQTGQITDVNLYMGDMDSNAPKFKSSLYDIQIELNCPFKPYDLIKLPLRDQYQVVGDETDGRIKKVKNESERVPWKQTWLKMNMSTYFSSTWDCGEIRCNAFTKLPFCLDDIRKVEENEMTIGQQKMIEYIKSSRED